jgi:DNA-binding XRE family transcriptional regulator
MSGATAEHIFFFKDSMYTDHPGYPSDPWRFEGHLIDWLYRGAAGDKSVLTMDSIAPLSSAQVRAARAWLHWTQDELAEKSGVSQKSIARYELELSAPYTYTLVRLRDAFESAGISFQFDGMIPKGIRAL